MKKGKMEDIKRLELISHKLDRIPKEKLNPILEDMKWLVQKLRETFIMVERN